MSFESAQAMLFGIAFSDISTEGNPPLATDANLFTLSSSMLDMLSNIETKVINLNQLDSTYIANMNSLLDFVILAYLYQDDVVSLRELILNSKDKDTLIASRLGIVSLTLGILNNTPEEVYFSTIWRFSSGISYDYDMTIRKIGHILGWGSEVHAIRHIGTGGTPQEIVTLTLYSILRHSHNYMLAIKSAMKASQNSELTGQIVAALMGIKLGIEGLPQIWVKHCENRKYILKLAHDMILKR